MKMAHKEHLDKRESRAKMELSEIEVHTYLRTYIAYTNMLNKSTT